MILIHTALLSEAQAIIERYNLKLIRKNPRIYKNHHLILIVSGIGKVPTLKNVPFLFQEFLIDKVINIGIAGCNDLSVSIGELFCTNKNLKDIKHMPLITVDKPQRNSTNGKFLFDMEAKYFEQIAKKNLDEKDIYIFKVVSDHLDDTILPKDFVKKLIADKLEEIENWI